MKIVDYLDKYAQTMADMWNASEEGWPGGLTRGVPMTAKKVKEQESRVKSLGGYIVMERSKAIGFVRVSPYFEEKEAAYVSWLNVIPEHHGKSHGRRLLCRSVECSTDLKLDRLDLHTWPGNIKALPAYKKTGFYWVPNTTVYMQNFIPMIMLFQPAKPYFEKHDWYDTFQRPIELEEDGTEVEGMNVFVHRWKEGKDELIVWIDRESRNITGFENNDMKVFAKLDRHDVLAGMKWKITWTITNKTKKKFSCSLKVTPPKGVSLKASKKFVVPAGKSKEISAPVMVSLEAKEIHWEEKSDSILTRMKIDDQSFNLRTGLRTKQAIEIESDPEFISVVPGTERTININLRNNLKKRAKGRIRFKTNGLDLDKTAAPFSVQKDRFSGVPLTIKATSPETKCYSIKAWAEFEDHRTKEKTLKVRCIGIHGAISDIEEKSMVMENEEVRLVAKQRGGFVTLYDKAYKEPAARHVQICLGPPFIPSELARLDWRMSVKNEKGTTTGTLSVLSEEREGLRITLQIGVSSSNLLRFLPILENKGKSTHSTEVQFVLGRNTIRDRITLPTKHGLIQEEVIEDDFPDWMGDIPKEDYLRETWCHMGNKETGLGVLWDRESTKHSEIYVEGVFPTLHAPKVRPGEKLELPPYYFMVGTTDWRRVQRSWQRLYEGEIESEEKVVPQGVLDIGTVPKPVVVENETNFKFRMRNLRNKRLDAKVNIDFPDTMKASKTRIEAKELCIDSPLEEKIVLKARKASPGMYFAKARISTLVYDDTLQLPIVVIGKPGSVSVRQKKGIIDVNNGTLKFTVVPEFSGSLTSLKEGGIEHILSAYPKPDQLAWFRPWYGGIAPTVTKDEWFSRFYEETFTGKKVTRGAWKGARTTAEAEKRELLRGLRVSTEYLTRPNSNVLAILQDFTNTGKSSLYFEGGCASYFQVGGSKKNVAYFSRSGWRQRKYSKRIAFTTSDNRTVVVSNTRKKKSVCFVSSSADMDVLLLDFAKDGKHLLTNSCISLKPKETKRFVSYLVLSTTPSEAKKYQVLSEYVDEDLMREKK